MEYREESAEIAREINLDDRKYLKINGQLCVDTLGRLVPNPHYREDETVTFCNRLKALQSKLECDNIKENLTGDV